MVLILPREFFLFSRYLGFCLELLVKWQIRKMELISNFMTSQFGQKIIVIHILSSIWRSKGNRIMTFGQLTECNMRNIFLEKLNPKYGGETSLKHFLKILKLIISLNHQSKVLHSLFLLYVKLNTIKIY